MEAQNSKPTLSTKLQPQFIFSRFPIRLQEGTLAVCPLFYFLWFPALSCSKCSKAIGPPGSLSFQRSRNGRHICLTHSVSKQIPKGAREWQLVLRSQLNYHCLHYLSVSLQSFPSPLRLKSQILTMIQNSPHRASAHIPVASFLFTPDCTFWSSNPRND